eukprot:2415503-Prymnesium_polylepis.1
MRRKHTAARARAEAVAHRCVAGTDYVRAWRRAGCAGVDDPDRGRVARSQGVQVPRDLRHLHRREQPVDR